MTDNIWHGTDSEDGFPTSGHPQPSESGRAGCLPWLLAAIPVLVIGSQIGHLVVP